MKEFKINVEKMYKMACEELGETDRGLLNTWKELYNYEVGKQRFSDGELENTVSELLSIPEIAKDGFVITQISIDSVTLSDLEESGNVDLKEDTHCIESIRAFRNWINK